MDLWVCKYSPGEQFRQFKASLPTTYESIAIREADLEFFECLSNAGEISSDWEHLPPRNGVVYLRLHLSGPKNTTSPGWGPL